MSQIKLRNERDERVAAAIINPYYELCTLDMKSYDSDYDGKGWQRCTIMPRASSRNS